MNMDRTQQSVTRLSDPPAAASEPSPGAPEPITKHPGRFLPSTRYRHPGDVIRLIGSGLVLAGMLAAVALAPNRLTGPGAAAVTWLGSDPAGRLLAARRTRMGRLADPAETRLRLALVKCPRCRTSSTRATTGHGIISAG